MFDKDRFEAVPNLQVVEVVGGHAVQEIEMVGAAQVQAKRGLLVQGDAGAGGVVFVVMGHSGQGAKRAAL